MTAYLIHTETNPTFTRISRYVPSEEGIQLGKETDQDGRTTVTLSIENPDITHFAEASPGPVAVARALGVRESAPITLNSLHEAYEQAEVPTEGSPIREGDEVITPLYGGGFEVWDSLGGEGREDSRILRRAPQPEPWQALADVLGGWLESPTELAKYLYERGVRVAGGDDDE